MWARFSSAPAVPRRRSCTLPDQKFEIGKSVEVVEGKDVTIIANGLLVAEVDSRPEALEAEGISARVIDMHTMKPLDREAIERRPRETGAIVVAEEHLVDGGLGVRVAQAVAETHPCPMEFVGIQNTYAESGHAGRVAGEVRVGGEHRRHGPQGGRPEAVISMAEECLAEALLQQSPACSWLFSEDLVFQRFGDAAPYFGKPASALQGRSMGETLEPELAGGGSAWPAPWP